MVTRRIPLKLRRALPLVEDAEKVRSIEDTKFKKLTYQTEHSQFIFYFFVFSEPLSKLLKTAKQNAANTDGEKVSDDQR